MDEGKRPPSILTKPPHKDPSLDFLAQEYVTSPPPPDSDKDLFEGRVDGLYLVLISLHGLVRGERMELGKDPDTGGQVQPASQIFTRTFDCSSWVATRAVPACTGLLVLIRTSNFTPAQGPSTSGQPCSIVSASSNHMAVLSPECLQVS